MFSQEFQDGDAGIEIFSASGNLLFSLPGPFVQNYLAGITALLLIDREEPRKAVESVFFCASRV
jgi:hypothetical protein